jgi:hypothetical protein
MSPLRLANVAWAGSDRGGRRKRGHVMRDTPIGSQWVYF